MVERTRAAAQECREAWEATVTKKNAVLAQTGEGKSDLETRRMKGASTARGVSNSGARLVDAQAHADRMRTQAEEAEATKAALEREIAELKAQGVTADPKAEAATLAASLAEAKLNAELGEQAAASLVDAERELKRVEDEHAALEAEVAAQAARLKSEKEGLETELAAARAAAGSAQRSAGSGRSEKDELGDQLGALKAEVEELTVSHDLEVERLQERLGQLQTVQDKLELALREQRAEHEKTLADLEALQTQKAQSMSQGEEQVSFNLKESQAMLRTAKEQLKKETKAKEDANTVLAETKAELDEVLREGREKELSLQQQLTQESTLKEQLDAKLAAEKVQTEEAIATLKTQLADAKVTLKENEKKATEYAKEYGKEFYLRKQIAEQLQELTGGLRVFCRVRPPPPGDDSGDAVTTLDETTVLLQDKADKKRPTRRFEFGQVYGATVDQAKVFRDVEPMIAQTLDGINVCVMVYGGGGTGKTHTLAGGADDPGLINRAVSCIFDLVASAEEGVTHEAFLSILAIDGERIADLQGASGPFEVVRDATYGMQVEGLTTTAVHTASHVKSLLASAHQQRGDANSELVVTVTVRTVDTESGESNVGRLTLVDLPPSEGHGATKDATSGYASIRALHDVVGALAQGKKQIPYANSLLTTLLQDSLGGNSKTLMIVTVSPTQAAAYESGAALAFGEKARKVSLGPASKNKESMQTAMNKVNTTMSALTQHAGATTARRGK